MRSLPITLLTGTNFRLCSTLLHSNALPLCHNMATMKTINSAKNLKENLNWAVKDSLTQVQGEVEKLHAANEKTEEQLQSLIS